MLKTCTVGKHQGFKL